VQPRPGGQGEVVGHDHRAESTGTRMRAVRGPWPGRPEGRDRSGIVASLLAAWVGGYPFRAWPVQAWR
jgi:hypothetical protein